MKDNLARLQDTLVDVSAAVHEAAGVGADVVRGAHGASSGGSGRGIRLNQLVALGGVLRWEAFSLRRMCSPAVVFA